MKTDPPHIREISESYLSPLYEKWCKRAAVFDQKPTEFKERWCRLVAKRLQDADAQRRQTEERERRRTIKETRQVAIDAFAEKSTKWFSLKSIEGRMRNRERDFDEKGPLPGVLREFLRALRAGDYGDRSVLLLDPDLTDFDAAWLADPALAPDFAFASVATLRKWEFHGEKMLDHFLVATGFIERPLAIRLLNLADIELPSAWDEPGNLIQPQHDELSRDPIELTRTPLPPRPNSRKEGIAWDAAERVHDWGRKGLPNATDDKGIVAEVQAKAPIGVDGKQVQISSSTILRAVGRKSRVSGDKHAPVVPSRIASQPNSPD